MESTALNLDGTDEVLDRIESTGDRVLGRRVRDASGQLLVEWTEQDGVRHGYERHWGSDGRLEFETFCVQGLEHGVASQWHAGQLLGRYRMEHGTGVDLWRDPDGALLEERHCVAGRREGAERWWTGDNRTVWLEGYFHEDVRHGVFRQWTPDGHLRRGYPRFFIAGCRVSRAEYVQATRSTPLLPPYREPENAPVRPVPREYGDPVARGE